jgi:hypothetical protein
MNPCAQYGVPVLASLILLAIPAAQAAKPGQQSGQPVIQSRYEWRAPQFRPNDYPTVRLITLLVNGQSLINQKVTVTGVLSLEFEDTNLYLSKEAYRYLNTGNALSLTMTPSQQAASKGLQGQYAEISGTIAADPAALIRGSIRITSITRIALGGPIEPRR